MFPKLHHGPNANQQAIHDLSAGWANAWRARGFSVSGWGWLQGDPVAEAELAVELSQRYDLDGYIANAESPYEFAGWGKSEQFVKRFRELAPRAPLALSHIGWGSPYRKLDFGPWLETGAALMPQAYQADFATSVNRVLSSSDALGAPRRIVIPTLGTSGFNAYVPPAQLAAEIVAAGLTGFNVWLLESTPDDTLRALTPAVP